MLFKRISSTLLVSLALLMSSVSIAQELDIYSMEQEPININTADASTIAEHLAGIGMYKAQAIVNFREEQGEFSSLEDLMLVTGIGEQTILNNQDKIAFD